MMLKSDSKPSMSGRNSFGRRNNSVIPPTNQDVLKSIHDMRMKYHQDVVNLEMGTKLNLPVTKYDQDKIMEQYYASKKQM
jgi:hypothetical protein